jgi:hypothetical protein
VAGENLLDYYAQPSPEYEEIYRRPERQADKPYPEDRVRFALADAYALEQVEGAFTAGLAAFWWSHVPLERRGAFLTGLYRRLGAGAMVLLIDNRFVEGSSTAIGRTDSSGNT